jgi:hypothetical protein
MQRRISRPELELSTRLKNSEIARLLEMQKFWFSREPDGQAKITNYQLEITN